MSDEKRMIEGYEVKNTIRIGGKELIFAEDLAAKEPYMVCECRWNSSLGIDVYENAYAMSGYLEAMSEFLDCAASEVQHVRDQREERGVSDEPLTAADCVPDSRDADYKNQLVIIKPDRMVASARTADHQLLLAMHGNGCNPDARGQAVFCKDLFSGEMARWERFDVAGIIQPERIPEWAHQRLRDMGIAVPALSQQVYFASADEAREKNELPAYRESNKQNAACADSIKDAINNSHRGNYSYDFAAALKAVIAEHGAERVNIILANTVDYKDYDGRFSHENKAWAKGIQLPDMPKDRRAAFVCEAHPALLDGFINALRKEQQEKKPSVVDHLKAPAKAPAPKKKDKPTPDKAR